jgi:branched-chain amino acid transport system ATP-binding protein
MLEVTALRAGYGKIAVLAGVDLNVDVHEIVALVGTNGSGKSTLLRSICGLIPVTSGTIRFRDEDITGYPPQKRVPLGIVMVPESREIFTQQTVMANLMLGAYPRMKRLRIGDYQRDLEFVFSLFPVLGVRPKQLAATLSGGEQQMLAIGRALMSRPQLLILDEPSTGLAPLMVREIFDALLKLNKEMDLTILLVEQNSRQALRMADRGYIMVKGSIVHTGEALALLKLMDREGLTY